MSQDEESAKERYRYEIKAVEGDRFVTYYCNEIDVSTTPYVTFVPRFRSSANFRGKVTGETMIIPAQNIARITLRQEPGLPADETPDPEAGQF
jgi:hypothetical protein